MTVLVGGLNCPNDVFAIGKNCYGELGLGNNESVICWRQLDRCSLFDCQIVAVFAGRYVTFYVTQSHRVYAAGQWKCFVNSTSPTRVNSICENWRIKDIAISSNQIIFLGSDGCIFGLGDNSLGELGLCHLECVTKPHPLVFFYKLNSRAAKQLSDSLAHPVEKNYKKNKPFGCGPCPVVNPCGPCPVINPCGPAPCGPYFDGQYGPDAGHKGYKKNNKYNPNARCFAPGKYGKY